MRFPVTFDVAGHEVHAHAVLEWLGYAAGFQLFRMLRRRAGDVVEPVVRWSTIAAAAVGAALGSKLLYLVDDPAETWAHRGDVAFLLGGKTIVGGILGGWIAVELVKRRMGVTRRTGDLFAAPLLVGIAVGRIGCFLEGLGDKTYGVATELPWGVDFGDGVARHPAQLYETLFLLAVAVPVVRATLGPHPEGFVFRATVALYLAWRFVVDFLKPRDTPVTGIQLACLAGVLFIFVGEFRRRAVRTFIPG